MKVKKCSGCKVEKPISEFGKNKRSKDGLKYYCRECISEINRTEQYKTMRRIYCERPEVKERQREKKLAYQRRYQKSDRGKAMHRRAYYKYIKTDKGKLARWRAYQKEKQKRWDKRKEAFDGYFKIEDLMKKFNVSRDAVQKFFHEDVVVGVKLLNTWCLDESVFKENYNKIKDWFNEHTLIRFITSRYLGVTFIPEFNLWRARVKGKVLKHYKTELGAFDCVWLVMLEQIN